MPEKKNTELRKSLALVTIAGCLAIVYMTGVQNPMTTKFLLAQGFTEWHFGILGALPMLAISMQFVGALLSNRLKRRKATVLSLVITGRILWLAIALIPFLLPDLSPPVRALLILGCIAVTRFLLNLFPPIWFSWMGDLIPKRVLNRYWGQRGKWMWLTMVAGAVPLSLFGYYYDRLGLSLNQAFLIAVCIGVAAGIIDILLFIWVDEPENICSVGRGTLDIIFEPFRTKHCRSYLVWNCAYMASAMVAAVFMQPYVLKVLGIPLWKVILIWSTMGLGSALVSGFWGRIADKHGHRPIFSLCSILKPMAPLVFFFITAETIWLLALFFFFDSMLNTGLNIAKNGFMLKLAPRENRGMFVAAMTSLPGIAAGIASIIGGAFLSSIADVTISLPGKTLNSYQILFAISFALRIICIYLATRIKEPDSTRSRTVLFAITGELPLRLVTFPVGLYRRLRNQPSDTKTTDTDDDSNGKI